MVLVVVDGRGRHVAVAVLLVLVLVANEALEVALVAFSGATELTRDVCLPV